MKAINTISSESGIYSEKAVRKVEPRGIFSKGKSADDCRLHLMLVSALFDAVTQINRNLNYVKFIKICLSISAKKRFIRDLTTAIVPVLKKWM